LWYSKIVRLSRTSVLALLSVVGLALGAYVYLQQQFKVVEPLRSTPTVVEIPAGLRAREVVRMLHEAGLIADEKVAMAYLILSGNRSNLRAGEYQFDNPMTVPEVLDKLVRGEIRLHRFTVPEGLTVGETAVKWEEQGFGTAAEFVEAAKDAVPLVKDFDSAATSVEGYLFPETYSFPARTTAAAAVKAMVTRFRHVIAKLEEQTPSESWPRDLRQTVILASLVETEAVHDVERPIIASVYLNRLTRSILLQCDPTVVYVLKQQNRYKGRLTTADLKVDSPYNTYRYPGLPPTAIANPGRKSLEAAIKPAATTHLFFVRTEGGRHTFTDTLAAHNRAVAAYRAMLRRQK
jgi:UPF0755 protein